MGIKQNKDKEWKEIPKRIHPPPKRSESRKRSPPRTGHQRLNESQNPPPSSPPLCLGWPLTVVKERCRVRVPWTRRVLLLPSTHTYLLSRRNTASRIIMYSISLRVLSSLLVSPRVSDCSRGKKETRKRGSKQADVP